MNIQVYRFTGNHYEVGVQQGKAMRESIHDGIEAILASELIKSSKPKLVPISLYYSMAKRRADHMLRNDIFKYQPKQAQRMQGIADGAEVDLQTILFTQMLEVLIGCTTVAVSQDRTSTSETIMAKNFDYVSFLVPYNLARSTDKAEIFVPLGIILQEMLETCVTVDEGVGMIMQSKRGGHDGLITLTDSSGAIKTVELSSHFAVIREAVNGQAINTNNYQTVEMQKHEVPLDSGSMPGYRTSPERVDRAMELLKGTPLVDEAALRAVLCDHGKEGIPSIHTICKHGEPACTHRSMIFFPRRKTIKVLFGNPCQGEYQEIGFT